MARAIYYLFYMVFFLLLVFRGACNEKQSALRAMDAAGHKDVSVLGHKWLFVGFRGCEATDASLLPVVSTNPAGKRV